MAAGRYFRLTIPILAASFIGYAMMRTNLLFNRDVWTILPDPWVWRMMFEQTPSIFSWLKNSLVGVHLWGSSYNPFLWTMPIELYGSFALFGAIALFGEKRAVRIGALSIELVVAELLNPSMFYSSARTLV